MNTNNNYWSTLQNAIEFVKFSETKAGVVLTVYGILITLVYSNAKAVILALESNSNILYLSIASAILFISSLILCFLIITPSLKNFKSDSIIYFKSIYENFSSYEDYFEKSKGVFANDSSFHKEVAEQIYVNSKIATKKFKLMKWSMWLSLFNLIILVIILIIYLF